MIDYLNAVFPCWGVFVSEQAAWDWIERYDPHGDMTAYKVFYVSMNTDNLGDVPTSAPNRRYINQR